MRILSVIILLIPLITFRNFRNKDQLFSPINVFSILYFIRVMIPTIIYSGMSSVDRISDNYLHESVISNDNYFFYSVLQTICYFFVVLGLRDKSPAIISFNNKRSILNVNEYSYKHYLYWGLIFTIIGFIDFMLVMHKIGGITHFVSNLRYRTIMLRDIDLLSWLLIFLHYGPLLIVYSLKDNKRKINVFLFVLVVVAGLMCGLGGRKTVIVMIAEMIFVYHFSIKEITLKEIFKTKNYIIAFGLFIFFVVMVQLRREGAFEIFLSNPFEFFKDSQQGILSVFTSESYVKHYMAIMLYFSDHPFWLGKSFLGLITAFVPSSLYFDKPPVDDGMYLYSICIGRQDIIPIMPARSLNLSSYPLETFGSMYANFGVIGLLIGMFLLGKIIKFFYRRLINNGCQIIDIILYTQIVFCFELSTLRIFQIFEIFLMLGVIVYFVEKFPIYLIKR